MNMKDIIHPEWFPALAERIRGHVGRLGTALGELSLALEACDPAKAWKPLRTAEEEFSELMHSAARALEAAEEWRKIAAVRGYRSTKEWKRRYATEYQRERRARQREKKNTKET